MCVNPAMLAMFVAPQAAGTIMQAQGEQAVDKANADAARATGFANENIQRDKARRDMAQQVASLSGRSLDISSGTPLALQAESARNSELDALTTRANANNQAQIYDLKRKESQAALPFTIAGQMLSSASSLAKLGAV